HRSLHDGEPGFDHRWAGGQKGDLQVARECAERFPAENSRGLAWVASTRKSAVSQPPEPPIREAPGRPPYWLGQKQPQTGEADSLFLPPEDRLLGCPDLVGPTDSEGMRGVAQELRLLVSDLQEG